MLLFSSLCSKRLPVQEKAPIDVVVMEEEALCELSCIHFASAQYISELSCWFLLDKEKHTH